MVSRLRSSASRSRMSAGVHSIARELALPMNATLGPKPPDRRKMDSERLATSRSVLDERLLTIATLHRKVDAQRFALQVRIDGFAPQLAAPAGLFVASKGHRWIDHTVAVHPHIPSP